jgi:hypothetical protein
VLALDQRKIQSQHRPNGLSITTPPIRAAENLTVNIFALAKMPKNSLCPKKNGKMLLSSHEICGQSNKTAAGAPNGSAPLALACVNPERGECIDARKRFLPSPL